MTGQKKTLFTSATQIDCYLSCIRKWFFQYVLKLPVFKDYPFVFGIVFHAVFARWLEADETGRDKDDKPVELYPKDWTVTDEGVLKKEDEQLIKDLLQIGIEEGIITRYPDGDPESKFIREILEGVNIIGYIDYIIPSLQRVDDHKTISDFKWAKSSAALKEDVQLLIYAAELCFRHFEKHGKPPPDGFKVTVRHNQFLKDHGTPRGKFTEAELTMPEISSAWKKFKEIAGEMLKLWRNPPEDWTEVPEAEEANTCNKYGGCPFRMVCGKAETIQGYTKRTNRRLGRLNGGKAKTSLTGGSNMNDSLFDELENTETPAASSEEKAASGEPEVFKSPPWAQENCTACNGAGLNTKGNPCRICDSVCLSQGIPGSGSYTFNESLDGWLRKDTEAPVEAPEEEPASEPEDQTKKLPEQKALLQAMLDKQISIPDGFTIEDVQAKLTGDKPKEAKKGEAKKEKASTTKPKGAKKDTAKKAETSNRGRPPQGLTLCIGCSPTVFGSRDVVSVDEIFQVLKGQIAEENKKESFYQCDPFKRRDRLAVLTENHLHKENLTGFVTASPGDCGPDYKTCLEVVRSFAQTIIE